MAPAAPVAQPIAQAEESIRLPKQLTKAQVEAATRDLARTLGTKHPLN